jgi:hypothetical protein
MILVVKFLFVALAVFGQTKLFQEKPVPAEVAGGLDTLALPVDNPELVLAKRAMEAHGLCPAALDRAQSAAPDTSAQADAGGDEDADSREGLANNCF